MLVITWDSLLLQIKISARGFPRWGSFLGGDTNCKYPNLENECKPRPQPCTTLHLGFYYRLISSSKIPSPSIWATITIKHLSIARMKLSSSFTLVFPLLAIIPSSIAVAFPQVSGTVGSCTIESACMPILNSADSCGISMSDLQSNLGNGQLRCLCLTDGFEQQMIKYGLTPLLFTIWYLYLR